MKNNPWHIIIVFSIGLFIFISDCTKEPEYLEKYLGSWLFENTWSRKDGPFLQTGDTVYYEGVIKYGTCKKCLLINHSGSLSKNLKVEPDGQILNTCEPPLYPLHSSNTCSGYFEGDSIFHYETITVTPPNHIVTNRTSIFGRKL